MVIVKKLKAILLYGLWLIGADVGAEGKLMSGSGISYFGDNFYILKTYLIH